MNLKALLVAGLALVDAGLVVKAAPSFAGANLYYAAGLTATDAETLLS